ncbi:MAG TPA: folylpolyglutamate synthase/dihydrofolate synthase family protein [Planctomycetota bacterium]
MFRAFDDAFDFLRSATDYERMAAPLARYDLRRMEKLVRELGHPERSFRCLHIAGTKGKGSTAHMAEALLRTSGFRTGLYTSPHLVHPLERIRLDGRPIPESEFLWAMNRMEDVLRRLKPTFFEIMTAGAFLVFARRRVDWAVIEVGLGGRLDATNVIRPEACAITTIDYDHMDRLGTTLAAIAGEKAGIRKPGVPLVSSPQRTAAARVIGKAIRPSVQILRAEGGVLEFKSGKWRARLRAAGRHQAANAATALALVEAGGVALRQGAVRRAFAGLRLPARTESIGRVVVDAAHNPVAARALAAALKTLPRARRTILVFGASADKDTRGMIRALAAAADFWVLTRADHPRAADPASLRAPGRPAVIARSVAEGMATARALAGPGDRIVVTGSFYVAGEALAWLGLGG